jgi:hypothetical protein
VSSKTARFELPAGVIALLLALANPAYSAPNAYQLEVLADQPLLYYQFNEPNGNVVNHGSLGSGHDGVVNGTPLRNVPTIGGDSGIEFNSVDDYIQSITTSPVSLNGNPSFSAEAVFFIPLGGDRRIVGPVFALG